MSRQGRDSAAQMQLFMPLAGCIIRGMNLEQEKALVERARSSQEAFGELYDMYYNQIFGYVLRRSADIEVARDITSAVFFKALTHIKSYRWKCVPFSHWLYRIANHEIVNHYNRSKREVIERLDRPGLTEAGESSADVAIAESQLRKYEDYLDLQNCISRLPSKYQEVISLKYFEGMDIKAIADVLAKPEGTVKSLLHRGIEQLRKMMEP